MGLCCMGLSTGTVHYGVAWPWNVHDFSNELVCGMSTEQSGGKGYQSLTVTELLVCPLHSDGNEPDLVSHHLLIGLSQRG